MKYSKESIAKVAERIRKTIEHVVATEIMELKPRLIKGNRKIGDVWHFSTAAIASCGNCGECKWFCYELKAYLLYPSVLLSRCRNYVLTRYRREYVFTEISEMLKRKRTEYKWFRWHVGGEIQDMDYFERMIQVAVENPDWHFYTYTKMYHIVNEWCRIHGGKEALPKNLAIMFSEWDGMPMDNPYNFPTFRCIMADGSSRPLQDDEWLCPGKCKICIASGHGCPFGEKTANNEH